MDLGLDGRVAVVTGAGDGIGLACVQRLLAEGASVVGGDLDVTKLTGIGDGRVLAVQVDMTSHDAGDLLVEAALTRFDRLDVLVNNAGAARIRGGFLDVADADWCVTLELNLLGYVRAARAAVVPMLERGGGALVHIASEAARMPNPRLPDYSVSKAAVLMLSKVLAGEFTARGIRSNVVSPAFVRSPIYDRPGGLAESLAEEFGLDVEAALERYVEINKIPVGRLGRVQEVAAVVAFLASDQAGFVSGSDYHVDGGVTPVV